MNSLDISRNAKCALVIAQPPKDRGGYPDSERWRHFLDTVRNTTKPSEETIKIHDNCWQIPLDTDMLFLSKLFESAQRFEVQVYILFLDAVPDWIKYPANAETSPEV